MSHIERRALLCHRHLVADEKGSGAFVLVLLVPDTVVVLTSFLRFLMSSVPAVY